MTADYLSKIFATFQKGDAREESYYKHLAELISNFSLAKRNKKVDITILPKKTEAGNPDFRVWDGKQKITGYIEAKELDAELYKIEETEQIQRYLSTFPNFILTNFTEFRLYRNGELIDKTSIARPFIIKKLSTLPPVENEDKFFNLLERFLDFSLPNTYSAKSLAIELAKRTKFLDEVVREELRLGTPSIHSFYNVFKEYLIARISEKDFADIYSQTITYGLFAARLRTNGDFNRKLAYDLIPKSIGILRDVFKFISLEDIPQQMEIIIDDISEVLNVADVKKILEQYYREGKGSDPILHFYETFLAEYDPATREKRGVYYTPEAVVTFIVRSVHQILRDKFEIYDGLASDKVTVLDPAGGTLGFIAKSIEVAIEHLIKSESQGLIHLLIRDHILKNFYAFELMMAPYAIGHMKISFLLEEQGYKMKDDERVKYYLTNTLDMKELEESKFPGMSSLSTESHEAGKVKKEIPILVIIGNPPYSGHSENVGEWISEAIKDYYQVDGEPLGEKNPKWLQDDYVKFIRFAQWKIDKAGEGIIGFITNHSFLDNPTFRGMRRSLMNSFNEIYVLDLHGNSLKKEKAPDGSKDENVFDIKQGVAISFFVKYKQKKTKAVYHYEIFGTREYKYDFLLKNNIKKIKWNKINPNPKFYLFVPTDEKLQNRYNSFQKITDIFQVNSVGIVTARDNLTIRWTEEEIWNVVLNFSRMDPELARQAYNLGSDARDWKVHLAQQDLIRSGPNKKNIKPILYRPFDIRYTYYTGNSRGFHCMPRHQVMQHLLKDNLCLITIRRSRSQEGWNFAFISNGLVSGSTAISSLDINYVFPLYLYRETSQQKRKSSAIQLILFEPEETYIHKVPNINPKLLEELKQNFKKETSPEEIFYYIYAILYSNLYRTKYANLLKLDFPRIPFPKNYDLFNKLSYQGKQLAELHLLKSKELKKLKAKFPVLGNNKIEKVEFVITKNKIGRVWINESQYFEDISEQFWNYKIGGYQVCNKWLSDRKGRTLNKEEILTYRQIVIVISKTIEIQKEIDKYYQQVENSI